MTPLQECRASAGTAASGRVPRHLSQRGLSGRGQSGDSAGGRRADVRRHHVRSNPVGPDLDPPQRAGGDGRKLERRRNELEGGCRIELEEALKRVGR